MFEIASHIETETGSEKGFGIVFAIVFLLISLYPLINGNGVRFWALVIALIFLSLAFLAPSVLEKPNKLWHKLGLILGMIFGTIVMAIVFFVVVLPTGIIMRLLGKDLLRLKIDRTRDSYWIKREQPPGSMRDQF